MKPITLDHTAKVVSTPNLPVSPVDYRAAIGALAETTHGGKYG